jgi:hypothetical protein
MAVLAYLLLHVARRHRWQAVGSMLCAGVLAAALVVLLDDVASVDSGASVVPDLDLGPVAAGWFPSAVGVAILAALLTATAPWTSRRWRRRGWVAVVGLTLARVISSAVSFDSFRAVLIGWFAGGATLVALRRAPATDGRHHLRGIGSGWPPLSSITPASVDAWLDSLLRRRRRRQQAVRERWSRRTQRDLLFGLPMGASPRPRRRAAVLVVASPSSTRASLTAPDLGVPTPRFRALATADPGAFVIAYDAVDGRPRSSPLEQMTDQVLIGIEQLGVLRAPHRSAIFVSQTSSRRRWHCVDHRLRVQRDRRLRPSPGERRGRVRCLVEHRRRRRASDGPALASVTGPRSPSPPNGFSWALSGATRTAMSERAGLLDDLARRLR